MEMVRKRWRCRRIYIPLPFVYDKSQHRRHSPDFVAVPMDLSVVVRAALMGPLRVGTHEVLVILLPPK